ncbi:hypothetical protein LshimejAT787_0408040 [Lyophyllum shimeji]|uniref:Uncharacterized protein n=1 Tax=Lyophyllum shimeji TaxID=47721 RepID=A0A9P3PKU1_LYOSH|nr:hypothetical protein LshimejAT787_0408040 [Lyophyllum shimeji]
MTSGARPSLRCAIHALQACEAELKSLIQDSISTSALDPCLGAVKIYHHDFPCLLRLLDPSIHTHGLLQASCLVMSWIRPENMKHPDPPMTKGLGNIIHGCDLPQGRLASQEMQPQRRLVRNQIPDDSTVSTWGITQRRRGSYGSSARPGNPSDNYVGPSEVNHFPESAPTNDVVGVAVPHVYPGLSQLMLNHG